MLFCLSLHTKSIAFTRVSSQCITLGTDYKSISICPTASSVREKTTNEPKVARGPLDDSEVLEKAKVLVSENLSKVTSQDQTLSPPPIFIFKKLPE